MITEDFLFASGVNTIAVSPDNPNRVLINVRNSYNGTTHGIYESIDELLKLERVEIEGLMVIPPFDPDPEKVRPEF